MRDTALDIELSNLLPSESRWLGRKSIVAPVVVHIMGLRQSVWM
jgi:hypothetical protein